MTNAYWDYFLVLEDDLFKTLRYVELDVKNYDCFSIEYSKLLLSIGFEVDVICKELCKEIDPQKSPNNINEYKVIIKNKFPKLVDLEINIDRYNDKIVPWENWYTKKNPNWWKSYNDVKHDRIINYNKANLKNVIYAISGLLVLLLYLYKFVNNDNHKSGTKLLSADGMGTNITFAPNKQLPDF
jgi:hypothetical protein